MRTPILIVALIIIIPISIYSSARSNSSGLANRVAELEAQVEELSAILQYVHVETEEINRLAGPHWIVEGANVHVRSGSGETGDGCNIDAPNCESLTGLGNLIVGYNEKARRGGGPFPHEIRTGSHNLVVGDLHSYRSYAGFVAGVNNKVTHGYASICGGGSNKAAGYASSISGGKGNVASGLDSSVSGGNANEASGNNSSVSGGYQNVASGETSSVSGGKDREAPDKRNWAAGNLFEPN
jgi:hypothetical protein